MATSQDNLREPMVSAKNGCQDNLLERHSVILILFDVLIFERVEVSYQAVGSPKLVSILEYRETTEASDEIRDDIECVGESGRVRTRQSVTVRSTDDSSRKQSNMSGI